MNKVLKIAIVVVLCLIVILTITLFACQPKPEDPNGTTTTTTTTTTSSTQKQPCTEHTDADNNKICDVCGEPIEVDPPCTEHVDANNDNRCDVCDEDMTPAVTVTFENAEGTVYVVATKVSLRTVPSSDDSSKSNIIINMDTVLNRTGVSENWTRVEYEGDTYYLSNDYVVVGKPITSFTECNDDVYYVGPYQSINIRYKPTLTNKEDYSFVVGTINYGTALKRIATTTEADVSVDDEGEEYSITWAKVQYTNDSGKTVTGYINSKYLSGNPNPEEGDLNFEAKDDVLVVTAWNYNLRKTPSLADNTNIGLCVLSGTALTRIGRATTADNDGVYWSKVIYDGNVYYVNAEKPAFMVVKDPTSETPETFNTIFDGSLYITLPGTFDIVQGDHASDNFVIANSLYALALVNAKDIASTATIEQFAAAVGQQLGVTVTVKTNDDGVVYFELESTETVNGVEVPTYTLYTFHKGKVNNYYCVALMGNGTKAQLSNLFWGYAETIEVKTPTSQD